MNTRQRRGLKKELIGEENHISEAITSAVGDTDQRHLLPFLTERLEFRIPSDTSYLDAVLSYLFGDLVLFGIIEPDDSDIFVALDEAIVNAIRHGNKSDLNKYVLIVAEIDCKSARFTISDEGEGFDSAQVPDPTEPDNLLRPSGRGLLFIRHIMDEVYYNERGNQITMVKHAEKNCRPANENLKNDEEKSA